MATTMETGKSSAVMIPEHDKIGPLGSRASVLDNEIELRRALVREFNATAEAARDAATKVERSASGRTCVRAWLWRGQRRPARSSSTRCSGS